LIRRPVRTLVVLLILSILMPHVAAPSERSRPGRRPPGFRLFARSVAALSVNRVYCGLLTSAGVCTDTAGSGFRGGGFWPRGSADQYIFNSGFQLAGIVGGSKAENPWGGDTTGAFFFNGIGPGDGEQVQPIYNASNPGDLANWPSAALVPSGDATAALFDPILRGTPSASQGDVWWLTWDGNPLRNADRPHPLGVLLEQRGMAWNSPAGNQDIIYFIFTIYNITSTRAADYASVRPAMREILQQKAQEFQLKNNAAYGITLPANGYPITDIFLAFAADMDVGDPNQNYASVNVPFALGYTYQHDFPASLEGWTFDPDIFSPPFFPGVGLAGVKYLSSPRDSLGREVGLTLFGNLTRGNTEGAVAGFIDPANTTQLYRYLSANLDPARGDGLCNTGDPKVTHICFIDRGSPADLRFFQSSGPFTLPPGGSQSVAVAYIFAAPVAAANCLVACNVKPGDPTILGDAARMTSGVNAIDSITGYRGFTDANGDGRVDQGEFEVVAGSLLGKARVAQQVFDSKFAIPFGPAPPDFFLIPGDNQVTVLWRPSATERLGDPFFSTASALTVASPDGGMIPNPQYDPNYRQFDVEGYRVYRGRVDTPNRLRLIAQFDYKGTFIRDYTGQVNPVPGCAPELGIDEVTVVGADTTFGCPVRFDSLVPGVAPTTFIDAPLVGDVIQVRRAAIGIDGDRTGLATGEALVLQADTAVTGDESGCLQAGKIEQCRLRDTGVPFAFIDRGVRNNLQYFYAVTAFDVNSFQSVPSNLESPRTTQRATPTTAASNFRNLAVAKVGLLGRGTALDTAGVFPVLDPQTGRFSGPFPPANGFGLGLAEVAQAVLTGPGSFSVTLDSLRLGAPAGNAPGKQAAPATYFLTARADSTVHIEVPLVQDQGSASRSDSTYFVAGPVDPGLAGRFGGGGQFRLSGRVRLELPGDYYASAWGRGCAAAAAGFVAPGTTGCEYNGPRWFEGPSPRRNETRVNPQAAHPRNSSSPGPMPDLNNAGELTGVAIVQMPRAYETAEADYGVIEDVLGGAQRAADFNLFWGPDGSVDSVIDATHNVPVPFDSLQLAGSWGILNPAAASGSGSFDERADVLTTMDFTCVEPLASSSAVQVSYPCTATPYRLSRTATPGAIAIWDQTTANARTATVRPGAGFALYLAGNIAIFELIGDLPVAGSVWSLRTYVGAISGGHGAAGDRGPYVFTPVPRPFTAVGAELRLDYEVVNQVVAPSKNDLSQVHTVPDPYYVSSKYQSTSQAKVIQFVHLPADCIIRIYSLSGVLVRQLEHHSPTFGGSETWDVLNRNRQVVASGVYFYHIEAGDARRVGRFTVVNFAE
jgi:hypothetical protein